MGIGKTLKKAVGKVFVPIRDAVETAAVLGGNYVLPGSSLLTSKLVSDGSQKQLGSTLGQIANIGTGLAGAGVGSSTTGIKSAADAGYGWTNAANSVGGAFGNPTLGTDVGNFANSLGDKVSSGFSDGISSVGNATGLSNVFGSSTPSLSGADASFLDKAQLSSQGFSPSDVNFLSSARQGINSAVGAGTGGGASSYGGIGALLGGVNSLNANAQAQEDLLKSQEKALGALNPYLSSGASSNKRLSELLGTGGDSSAEDYGSLNTSFTASDLENDPGYQFQLEQGNNAINRSLGAKGKVFSGEALKAAGEYGTGLADTTFKDAYARDAAKKAQTYGMYAGQSGAGQNAANAAGDIYTNTGNAKANAGINSANILNQSLSSLLSGSGAKRLVQLSNGTYAYV